MSLNSLIYLPSSCLFDMLEGEFCKIACKQDSTTLALENLGFARIKAPFLPWSRSKRTRRKMSYNTCVPWHTRSYSEVDRLPYSIYGTFAKALLTCLVKSQEGVLAIRHVPD